VKFLLNHDVLGSILPRGEKMTNFAAWLRTQINPDENTAVLRALADPRGDWPWWTNNLGDYVSVIQAANPPNKDNLISIVSMNYGRWLAVQTQSEGPLASLSRHIGTLFLGLFGIIVAVAIFYGLFFNQKFFGLMAKVDQARGLITFLFAFATIAIMLLVAITTFWMNKDEVQLRFDKAKDLLTILIGVMGTILGFYFGTINSNSSAATTNPPSISNPGDQSGAGGAPH
jgi:hypothetical protein